MEKLGIELPLLLTQIVNFTIMVIVLSKLLYRPILKALADRRKKIEEGLAFAQKARDEEEKLEAHKQKILKLAREEAGKILENAKKEGRQVKEDFLTDGKKEVSCLKTKLEKEMKSRQEEMASDVMSHTVDIAAGMVARLLPDILTDKDQHMVIVKQLNQIAKRHEKRH